jgi:DNA-binding NarL/FixJ family response regulator
VLIRLGLALKDRNLQRYLERKLAEYDVRVESFGQQRTVWQKVLCSGCDVIVISESLLLRPADNGITILNELPESPTTVIIHDRDSAEEHAQLAAAGADVVLYAGISKKSMVEAMETTLESRRQYIMRRRFDRRGLKAQNFGLRFRKPGHAAFHGGGAPGHTQRFADSAAG